MEHLCLGIRSNGRVRVVFCQCSIPEFGPKDTDPEKWIVPSLNVIIISEDVNETQKSQGTKCFTIVEQHVISREKYLCIQQVFTMRK